MTIPVSATRRYSGGMPQDTDPQSVVHDDPSGKRAAARSWARNALADARARFDPAARDELRTRLGLPPAPAAER